MARAEPFAELAFLVALTGRLGGGVLGEISDRFAAKRPLQPQEVSGLSGGLSYCAFSMAFCRSR